MIRALWRQVRADFRAWQARRRFRRSRAQYLAAKERLAARELAASRMPLHERARHEAEQN
jgi:hypothetical protein